MPISNLTQRIVPLTMHLRGILNAVAFACFLAISIVRDSTKPNRAVRAIHALPAISAAAADRQLLHRSHVKPTIMSLCIFLSPTLQSSMKSVTHYEPRTVPKKVAHRPPVIRVTAFSSTRLGFMYKLFTPSSLHLTCPSQHYLSPFEPASPPGRRAWRELAGSRQKSP